MCLNWRNWKNKMRESCAAKLREFGGSTQVPARSLKVHDRHLRYTSTNVNWMFLKGLKCDDGSINKNSTNYHRHNSYTFLTHILVNINLKQMHICRNILYFLKFYIFHLNKKYNCYRIIPKA